TPFDPDDPTNVASKLANDRNIVVVFSAGNSGPIEATISGNFKKAPWVVSVANVLKNGQLAESSSRGVSGRKGTVTYPDGTTMTWEDRPTVAAPGTDIVSVRASTSSLQALSAPQDIELDPAYAPFYTYMSGTSMAAPHVAGVIALMLDANPSLTTAEVKQILQQTATNLPGYEIWEVGTGLVNAYAAVDRAFQSRNYGTLLNSNRTFHANAIMEISRANYTIDWMPVRALAPQQNRYYFDVPAGVTMLESWFYANGVEGQTGNTLNLDIYGPDGKRRASSGIYVLFSLYTDRAVQVLNPEPGRWYVEVTGLRGAAANPTSGVAAPETIQGILKQSRAGGYSGMNDIAGHAAESAIKVAVNERLIDGYSDGKFRPDEKLSRIQLADYLVMATSVRQYLPTNGSSTFSDVTAAKLPFAEAVAARGSNVRDMFQQNRGVMLAKAPGIFGPNDHVLRYALAYSLVQALGLEGEALARNGQAVTVMVDGNRIPIEDANQIPAGFEGYVSLALDLNLMNAQFSVTQGPFDLEPTLHATFGPMKAITRAEYAVNIIRYFGAWFATP
ncbi:MAG TPA: S8 family serine peptidase, partial [Terriglobales bacterium]|nr:S8 family serine peptidase [Terriglobales bacterium]